MFKLLLLLVVGWISLATTTTNAFLLQQRLALPCFTSKCRQEWNRLSWINFRWKSHTESNLIVLCNSSNRRVEEEEPPIQTYDEEPIPIPVLFENEYLLAVNKPAGIPYHDTKNSLPTERHIAAGEEETIDSELFEDGDVSDTNDENIDEEKKQQQQEKEGTLLKEKHQSLGLLTLLRNLQKNGSITYQGRLYGVHRLDRVTSGIVLFAKTSQVAGLLSKAFREKKITKYYVALSVKKPTKKKQGIVQGEMIRSRRGGWQLTRDTTTKSTNHFAKTRFYTCGLGAVNSERYSNPSETPSTLPRTLILFKPITGKTHQLRVASKSVGLPILGDKQYGGGDDNVERTYLHAFALHFDLDEIGFQTLIPAADSRIQKSVTILSYPPFDHLWDAGSQTTNDDDSKNNKTKWGQQQHHDEHISLMKGVVNEMMKKYCDCQPLRDRCV